MATPGESAAGPGPLVCRAPFVTLEFDPFGDVQACCANALYPLGNVASHTIDQIWRGPRVEQLRTALRSGDLTLGCGVCRHRIHDRGAELPLESYDAFPVPDDPPGWPHRLSFSLHNTCNLACVMCGADRSSKIRSRRTDLPPLRHAYDDGFFDQLVPYLEHCELVDFVGGEPFLVREHLRIWDLLLERGLRPRCGVTTNGTIWNERVEQVLDAFDTDLRVSIDGISRETFESIRLGASYDAVFANLERFAAYADERGTHLAINFSFVRHNWFELGELMEWAEERSIPVNVMTVIEPEHGVQRMPDDELAVVAEVLAEQTQRLAPVLAINGPSWSRQVAMVEAELDRRRRHVGTDPYLEIATEAHLAVVVADIVQLAGPPGASGATPGPERADDAGRPKATNDEQRRAQAAGRLDRWGLDHRRSTPGARTVLLVGADGVVRSGGIEAIVGPGGAGRPAVLAEAIAALPAALGPTAWLAERLVEDDHVDHTFFLGEADRDKTGVVVRLTSYPVEGGVEVLVERDDWFAPGPAPGATPVALSPRPVAT